MGDRPGNPTIVDLAEYKARQQPERFPPAFTTAAAEFASMVTEYERRLSHIASASEERTMAAFTIAVLKAALRVLDRHLEYSASTDAHAAREAISKFMRGELS
jgi:hypothetical protein